MHGDVLAQRMVPGGEHEEILAVDHFVIALALLDDGVVEGHAVLLRPVEGDRAPPSSDMMPFERSIPMQSSTLVFQEMSPDSRSPRAQPTLPGEVPLTQRAKALRSQSQT